MSDTQSSPLELLSLHFQYPGSPAMELRDPEMEQPLGEEPEWIRGQRNVPVAYVRGSLPVVRATFFVRSFPPARRLEICALGPQGFAIPPTPFSPWSRGNTSYVTPPLALQFAEPLPDRVGLHKLALHWFVLWEDAQGNPHQALLGTTTHTVCTTWRRVVPWPDQELAEWAYTPLVLWTSEWCAGAEDEKAVCDAIIRGLPRSGLRYGLPNWGVREMLLGGGGLCGGYYRLFQQMAHCQGVFVERRMLLLKYAERCPGEGGADQALVTSLPGVGNVHPTQAAADFGLFTDCRTVYPPRLLSELTQSRELRYTFWVSKDARLNGHCINFLRYCGELYVYDASFHRGGIRVDMELPAACRQRATASELVALTQEYLGDMFGLLESMEVEGHDFKAKAPEPSGVTVSMSLQPEVALFWWP